MINSHHHGADIRSSLPNRLWRVLATGFCFSLFGLGGLVLSLLWFPLLRVIFRDARKVSHLTQRSIRFCFRVFRHVAQGLGVFSSYIENEQRFNEDEGCLVIANHPSLLDYVFLASLMPRCDCIVKESLQRNRFIGGVIKAAGYIANSDSEHLLVECTGRLKNGGIILVFPEGTRSTPGEEMRLQRGAANIAVRANCDIRIVHIICEPPMLTKQGKWYNIPPIKPHFHITVQDKIHAESFLSSNDISPALAARRLTHHFSTELLPKDKKYNENK